MPVPHCFKYHDFVVSLDIRVLSTMFSWELSPSSTLFLFQDCSGYSLYLEIPHEFQDESLNIFTLKRKSFTGVLLGVSMKL